MEQRHMALVEDMFKSNAMTGVAVGLAAIVLGPTLFPTIGRVLRPAAKAVIKGGMVVYREMISEAGGLASNLLEEARSELEAEARTTAQGATETAGGARGKAAHRPETH
jgi:hypothetical protein